MAKSNDLFDDSAMSFGEHLEILRVYLIRAIIGWMICTGFTLYYGDELVEYISNPIKKALIEYSGYDLELVESLLADMDETAVETEGTEEESQSDETEKGEEAETSENVSLESTVVAEYSDEVKVKISQRELAGIFHPVDPEKYPAPEEVPDTMVEVPLQSEVFKDLNRVAAVNKLIGETLMRINSPVTHTVHEAFFIYLKVSLVAGFVLASPWIFYQLWLFVAAGLYPHERRYVHFYLPFSIGLFLTGALFCFFFVFPAVLGFLLLFNESIGAAPMMHMSEWISFALMLPVMFGLSFQLPVVMIVLERINIFTADDYREKRRISILVIAVLSMLLTPQDPQSMLLMMVPLCLLYEVGIYMCRFRVNKPEVTEEI